MKSKNGHRQKKQQKITCIKKKDYSPYSHFISNYYTTAQSNTIVNYAEQKKKKNFTILISEERAKSNFSLQKYCQRTQKYRKYSRDMLL